MDKKESTKKAIENYYERLSNKYKASGKKNSKPEKEVEKIVLPWLRANGFDVNVVESKAVWNPRANRFIRGQTDEGFSDIIGSTPDGFVCAIELKAPGKRSTLRPKQREFLVNKITRNGFAVCVDSLELLIKTYLEWKSLDGEKRKGLLLEALPVAKQDTDDVSGCKLFP